ncbi:hypothetical protein HAQ06_16205 [Pseudomonas sp. C2L12B]|uniref:Uncharacterized protein n=1 Tax=Pseudomonas typographi TaxID=2715964 RepID=A0ABR7Z3T8_9PSED|nr:hypothetical protein [Pseudomonas typographi]MBD1588195.1 hypothetical protein [Pseudomonas typographi]MBD1600166.1 hypothetical protein [Pseudomonas typographi]
MPGYPEQGHRPKAGAGQDEPGFDPDSPDVKDPQMDPLHPAEVPEVPGEDVTTERRAPGHEYPPYSKP